MKKFISLFLSLAMLLSIVSIVDFSAYAAVETGSCGDNVKYSLDTSTGVLTISGTGKMNGYSDPGRLGTSPFCGNKNIYSVIVENGVTSIGSCAFYNCGSLKSVTLSDNMTYIGPEAFYNCTSLTSIAIPNSVTDIYFEAFYGCSRLKNVTIGNGLESIGSDAFKYCSLANINVEDGNVKYSSQDGVLFNKDKTELLQYPIGNERASYDIPNGVTSIGDKAFRDCKKLTSVTIPNCLENIDYCAFNNCSNLEKVYYNGTKSDWEKVDISYDTDYYHRNGNYELTQAIIICTNGVLGKGNIVTINDLKYKLGNNGTTSVTGCSNKYNKTITIPEKIDYEGHKIKVTGIEDDAFYSCSELEKVYYNGTKSEWEKINISNKGNYYLTTAFIICTDGIFGNDNVVTVDGLKYKLNNDGTASVARYIDDIQTITIPEKIEFEGFDFVVTSIGDNAFKGCSKLKKIEIPDSVTSIGSNAFDGTAFYNTVKNWQNGVLYCGNHLISAKDDVTKITVKASTVSIANGALDNCKSLEKINILNPNCVINCTIPKTAVIGGAEGSTAEDYAQKNNMSIDYFEECTHENTIEVTIGATCTNQGAVQTRCEDCDKLISQTFIAPLGHTMVITTPAKAPTCTENGYSQAGYCTVCGYQETSSVVKALGHNYETTVVAPTCTAQGYTVYKCTRCGDTYNDNYVNATGHNFGNNSQYCLNGCGTANPNYAAPTQPSTSATQPTQAPTNAPAPVAPAPAEPTTVANTAATTTATQVEQTTTKAVAKPKAAKFKKVKGSKKAIALTWAKGKGVKGYQIQVATDKKFKKNKKTVTIKKQKTTKTTVKKLKAKKKYFVRIRTYKTKKIKGKNTKVYSSWSKAKTVKTK